MTHGDRGVSSSGAVARWYRGRASLIGLVGALVALALVLDPVARGALSGGRALDLGLLQLRLAYNTGVAFSLGAQLPTAVVLAVTAAITATIGVFAWRTAPDSSSVQTLGLAAIVAGATANVIDRFLDGKVTDYFHTGWWPTFNFGRGAFVLGALLLDSTSRDHVS